MSTEETIQFYLITFTILLTPIIIYSIVKFISYRIEKKRTEEEEEEEQKENELNEQQNNDKANRTVKYLLEKTIGKELTDVVFAFDFKHLSGEIEQKILHNKQYKIELAKKYNSFALNIDTETELKCKKILETKFYKNEYYQNSEYIMDKIRHTYLEYVELRVKLKEYENN